MLLVIGFKVNEMFAFYLGLTLFGVGVVGGLVWLVVKLGNVIKHQSQP
jgi:hypothetical protein